VISAVRDKLDLTRTTASLVVGVPAATASLLLFATTTGVPLLDTADHFINRFGILLVAVVSMLLVTWVYRDLDPLRDHLNRTGSVQLGSWWLALVGVVTPLALVYVLIEELRGVLAEPYEGYPTWLINGVGWGSAALVLVLALVLARLPWRRTVDLTAPSEEVSR
jgi:neurotransmitter:Na+ symporter, NSS family